MIRKLCWLVFAAAYMALSVGAAGFGPFLFDVYSSGQTTHLLYSVIGDFDGDGQADRLVTGAADRAPQIDFAFGTDRTTSTELSVSDTSAWSAEVAQPFVLDSNGDGRDDVILQPRDSGRALVYVSSLEGMPTLRSQSIAAQQFGIDWTVGNTRLIAGDFSGDNRDDLLLQPGFESGTGVLLHALGSGRLGEDGPAQRIEPGYLGLEWSSSRVQAIVGNFNGQDSDGLFRDDIFLRGLETGTHAVVTSDISSTLTQLVEMFTNDESDLPWGDSAYAAVAHDFDGSGRDQILLFSKAEGIGYLVAPAASGGLNGSASVEQIGTDKLGKLLVQARVGLTPDGRVGGGYWTMELSGTTTRDAADSDLAPEQSRAISSRAEPVVSAAGVLEGGLSAQGGIATYGFPIVIPPGRAGMAPSVSLAYSHMSGNGAVGVGWGVSGISSIARCSATAAHDGGYDNPVNDLGGVSFSSSDRFCLNGQHLRLVSGAWGADGSTYRTEIDDFSRVTLHAQAGEIVGFTVNDPSHLIHTFGRIPPETDDFGSISFAGPDNTNALEWRISRAADRFGNEIQYHYDDLATTNGGLNKVIKEISYTHGHGSEALRSIEFDYEMTRPDVWVQYRAGLKISNQGRLTTIRTKLGADTVREYRLFYESTASELATGRSLLKKVYDCSLRERDGSGAPVERCLPPTTFRYQGDASLIDTDLGAFGVSGEFGLNRTPVDLNGDGRIDFAGFEQGSSANTTDLLVWENQGGSFSQSTFTLSENINPNVVQSTHSVVDINLDGRSEFLVPIGDPAATNPPTYVEVRAFNTGADSGPYDSGTLAVESPTQSGPRIYYDMAIGAEGDVEVVIKPANSGDANARRRAISATFGQSVVMTLAASDGSPPPQGTRWEVGVRVCASGQINCAGNPITWSGRQLRVINGVPDGGVSVAQEEAVSQKPAQPHRSAACAAVTAPVAELGVLSINDAGNSDVALTGIPVSPAAVDADTQSFVFAQDAYFALDSNGDGIQDVLSYYRPTNEWRLYAGQSPDSTTPFALVANSCVAGQAAIGASVINYDGDGREDVLLQRSNGLTVLRSTGNGFELIALPITVEQIGKFNHANQSYIEPATPPVVADINGDGLTDLILARDATAGSDVPQATRGNIFIYLNTGAGFEEIDSAIPSPGSPSNQRLGYYLATLDADGDGDLDLLIPTTRTVDGYGPCINGVCTGQSFVSINDAYSWSIARFNDGDYSAPMGGDINAVEMTLRGGSLIDLNSSGRYEFVAEKPRTSPEQQSPEALPLVLAFGSTGSFVPSPAADLMAGLTVGEGYFDRSASFEYTAIVEGGNYARTPRTFGDNQYYTFAGNMHFVSGVETANGIAGGVNRSRFEYEDAATSIAGRGFAGFGTIRVFDESVGLLHSSVADAFVSETEYHQQFPLIGQIKTQTNSRFKDGSVQNPLSRREVTWQPNLAAIASNGPDPVLRYASLVKTTTWDPLDFSAPHAVLAVTERTIDAADIDSYGNVSKVTQIVNDADGNLVQRDITTTNFAPPDLANWWVNKALDVSVRSDSTQTGDPSNDVKIQRVDIANYTAERLPSVIHIEPMDAARAHSVTTTYRTDGNVSSVVRDELPIVTNADNLAVAQTSGLIYSASGEYFPSGQSGRAGQAFPTQYTFDPATGSLATSSNPNTAAFSGANVDVDIEYGAFGRIKKQTPLSGWPTEVFYEWSVAGCPATAVMRVRSTKANSPTKIQCVDMLGRTVRNTTTGFDGTIISSDATYDSLGRMVSRTEPNFEFNPAGYTGTTTINAYDYVGRPTQVTAPTGVQRNVSRVGLVTTTTIIADGTGCSRVDDAGSSQCSITTSKTRNALGQVIRTSDAESRVVNLAYDAHGNLVSSSTNGYATTYKYDQLGRRTQEIDPNVGTKLYTYTALGQLSLVTDQGTASAANYRKTRFKYDVLGRQIQRIEQVGSGTSSTVGLWTYDNPVIGGSPVAPYIDRLAMVTGDGTLSDVSPAQDHRREFSYDPQFSYLTGVSTQIRENNALAQTFSRSYEYGPVGTTDFGRLVKETLPNGAELEFGYTATGYLAWHDLTESGATRRIMQIDQVNARMQVEKRTFDLAGAPESMTEETYYGNLTGLTALSCWTVGSSSCLIAPAVVRTDFLRDSFDEIIGRTNTWSGESSTKTQLSGVQRDTIGRLKSAVLSRWDDTGGVDGPADEVFAKSYDYDAVGNIETKSDYGTYAYGLNGQGPYQLSQVDRGAAGISAFAYDDFGNTTSISGGGDNRLLTYTTSNKPRTITYGSESTSFKYDAHQSLYKRTIVDSGGESAEIYSDGDTEREQKGASTTTRTTIADYLVLVDVDSDSDGIFDDSDNCRFVPNANQRDTDSDGFGNICDGDFNNDGAVNAIDLGIFRSEFLTSGPHTDLSGDGDVNFIDLGIFRNLFLEPVGPGADTNSYDRFIARDELGSPTTLIDDAGAIQARYEHGPFGDQAILEGSTAGIREGFTGHEELSKSGIVHMGGRAYSPEAGRFLSSDPVMQAPGYAQNHARYGYVFNRPLSAVDPSGLITVDLGALEEDWETINRPSEPWDTPGSDGFHNQNTIFNSGGNQSYDAENADVMDFLENDLQSYLPQFDTYRRILYTLGVADGTRYDVLQTGISVTWQDATFLAGVTDVLETTVGASAPSPDFSSQSSPAPNPVVGAPQVLRAGGVGAGGSGTIAEYSRGMLSDIARGSPAIRGAKSLARGLGRYVRYERRLTSSSAGVSAQVREIEHELFGLAVIAGLHANRTMLKRLGKALGDSREFIVGRQSPAAILAFLTGSPGIGPSLGLLAAAGDALYAVEKLAIEFRLFLTTIDIDKPILNQLDTGARIRLEQELAIIGRRFLTVVGLEEE